MKTRAAVAFEAKKPLEIVELDLDGPRAGEVLVEIKATGICHTDAYTLEASTAKESFPPFWAMRARASCVRWAPASHRETRRSCHSALHAGMPPM